MSAKPLLIFHIDLNFTCLREEYLAHWIERLAGMGYNALLWELEDKVQWEHCPEVVWPEALSKTSFRRLLRQAEALGMRNIPLLQTIGHAEYVLKHKRYAGMREQPAFIDCYCTSKPEVRTFLKAWIEEFLDLFGESLEYFHLGGDEAYRFASCPTCKRAAETRGRNALYAEHVAELAEPILARGVRPGIWCDMVLAHPEQMEAIPDTFVIWDWNYWDGVEPPEKVRLWGAGLKAPEAMTAAEREAWPDIMDEAGKLVPFYTSDFLQRNGRDTIISSATRSHGDSVACGQHNVHAPNVTGAARKAARRGMLGTCVTSWAIRLHNLETQAPWIDLAARGWRQPEADFEALLHDSAQGCFGLDGTGIFEAIDAIGTPLPMTVTREVGLQVNGLKDPVPAPPGYLRALLAEYGAEGLSRKRESLVQGMATVRRGMATLHELMPLATRGLDDLHAWSKAGQMQLWMGALGLAVIDHASGATIDLPAWQALAESLQVEYRSWSERWLTPQSAAHTAALVFDPVREYLAQA